MSDCHSNDRSCRRSAMASRVEARRYRDKAHIKFVASRSCLVCERKPCDPHRLRFAQVRALGRKVSDEFTVPLCRLHRRDALKSTGPRTMNGKETSRRNALRHGLTSRECHKNLDRACGWPRKAEFARARQSWPRTFAD